MMEIEDHQVWVSAEDGMAAEIFVRDRDPDCTPIECHHVPRGHAQPEHVSMREMINVSGIRRA
jgi:hypothetical protein